MPKLARCIYPYLALLLALLAPAASAMDTGLDVQALLRRPGVKLLAVEFYADWCKPCMAAVPKWKALHEKYRAKGLHLVVVSVGEQGGCSSPGWNPDLTVCDLDTSIQKRLGANPLPQAFLWDWQGHLIASHAEVSQVEAAIGRYFAETPRILVSDPKDENGAAAKGGAALREQVRTELRKLAKFDLVASASEQATLKALRQQSHAAAYDETGACEIGAAVSANSELKIKLITLAPGRRKLFLQLYSVEQGCMKAAADASIQGTDTEAAVFTAVSSLVEQLIGKAGEAAPVVAKAAEPTVSGCTKDTDCKGERVCVKGECVEPGAKTASVPTPAAITIWTDPASHLTWQVSPPGNEMNRDAAQSYCSALSLDGYSDWRLPTVSELRSLIRGCNSVLHCGNKYASDQGCKGCNDNKGPAAGCYWPDELKGTCGSFWSSSAYVDNTVASHPNYACDIQFTTGNVEPSFSFGTPDTNYARCVR